MLKRKHHQKFGHKSDKLTASPTWDKVTAISTSVLAFTGIFFGYYQYKILKAQTEIAQSLRDHQIRAVLEVSFNESYEKMWIQNVGELAATGILVHLVQHGRGMNYSFSTKHTDINPGDRIFIKIPNPQAFRVNPLVRVLEWM